MKLAKLYKSPRRVMLTPVANFLCCKATRLKANTEAGQCLGLLQCTEITVQLATWVNPL